MKSYRTIRVNLHEPATSSPGEDVHYAVLGLGMGSRGSEAHFILNGVVQVDVGSNDSTWLPQVLSAVARSLTSG